MSTSTAGLRRTHDLSYTTACLDAAEVGGEFAVVERPVREPGAGEVLVKVLAASVQFMDIMLRKGQYPGWGRCYAFTEGVTPVPAEQDGPRGPRLVDQS